MSILQTLRKLSSAEEFFQALDLPYDPKVVSVCRLHILKRMGQYLREARLEDEGDEAAVREACRSVLERAYGDFLVSSPIEERVFKVLQDAIRPKEKPRAPFVPLASLVAPARSAVA